MPRAQRPRAGLWAISTCCHGSPHPYTLHLGGLDKCFPKPCCFSVVTRHRTVQSS